MKTSFQSMLVWVLVPPRHQLVIADGRRSPRSSDSPSPSRLVSYRVSAIEHGAGYGYCYWLLRRSVRSCPAAVYVFRSVQSQPGGR